MQVVEKRICPHGEDVVVKFDGLAEAAWGALELLVERFCRDSGHDSPTFGRFTGFTIRQEKN